MAMPTYTRAHVLGAWVGEPYYMSVYPLYFAPIMRLHETFEMACDP